MMLLKSKNEIMSERAQSGYYDDDADWNRILYAKYAEYVIATITNGLELPSVGYDVIAGQNKFTDEDARVEVKSTYMIQRGKSLRISNLVSKQGRCDYIAIVNMSDENNHQISIIPAAVFFRCSKFNSEGEEFIWSASMNRTDQINVTNTNLVREYLIDYK
tara:strand:+ start:111 stop:593 length:483 start_codon:yes stop_codon:yes gene_type:complete